ncbi:MAG TPA: hypothetical protein VKB41_05530 [Steroidobacteraceae bacterium]|nr:hypothetical protein [Steroidobacteraceae bacterium]
MNEPTDTPEAPAQQSRVKPPHWFAEALHRHPRLRRELWLLVAGLVVGFVLMPIAVYFVGVLTLGPYAAGGLGSFIADYYRGLFHGWLPGWGVVVGPYLLVQLMRLLIRMRRWFWPREQFSEDNAD